MKKNTVEECLINSDGIIEKKNEKKTNIRKSTRYDEVAKINRRKIKRAKG